MEPVTTLAVAGLSWLATTARGGIAEGIADRAFVATVRGIRERLPALASRPEGGDLARGLRRAQLCALERLILDYREQRPLAQLGGGSDAFSARALAFCRSAAAAPAPNLDLPHDALVLAAPPTDVATMAAGASAMEDAVLAELADAVDGAPMPGAFIDHFRNGGRGTPRFVELFGIYFAEQVKQDEAFREVLHTGLLLQSAANLAALGDWLAQVETRFSGALTRLESGVADLAADQRAGFAAVLEALAAEKGVPAAALRSILEKLGESAVPDTDILPRLSAKADEYVSYREQLSALAKAAPNADAVLTEGKLLLDAGDLDGARRLFAESHAALRSTRQQHARDEAALLAAEAGVDRLQLRYHEAANRYGEAERLVEHFDSEARFDYLCRRASTLQQHGAEFGDNAALAAAITLWRRAAELRSRADTPLSWATVQNQLGTALVILGERENGTARLEEAVAAYHAALTERTRASVPDQWSQTQNNLGNALSILGTRESGTSRLQEAVAAYRAALQERSREEAPVSWATLQNNLANALRNLGDRESGTALLHEAVAAYRAALDVIARDTEPRTWAMTQNNLGNALQRLGTREDEAKHLEESVVAYRAALQERPRDRQPLLWAMTMHNLGSALMQLGKRESGDERLHEALAVCHAALEERTRDRAPFHWAMTQNTLGNVLVTLGERTRNADWLAEAVDAYRNAVEIYEATGDSHGAPNVRTNLEHAERLLASVAAEAESPSVE